MDASLHSYPVTVLTAPGSATIPATGG